MPKATRRKEVERFDVDDEWVSALPFEVAPKGAVHLPLECVVYVPSTTGVDERISDEEFRARRDETARMLVSLFGGCRESIVNGRYVDDAGEVVLEEVAAVTGFGEAEDYSSKRQQFLDWLLAKKQEWGQESIGFEFEGDLWYI
jgi:hypothetical protein